jgi:hypothetical protein
MSSLTTCGIPIKCLMPIRGEPEQLSGEAEWNSSRKREGNPWLERGEYANHSYE